MIKVSRILHAGYVFQSDQDQQSFQIAFDPIFENPFSVNCYAYPPVQFDLNKIAALNFDAVFISHYHDDHCSFESLKHLSRQTPIYIYCIHEEMIDLIKSLGFENVYSIQLYEKIQIGPFAITPFRALDADVDSIFQISAHGLNILNVVDSWIDESTLMQLEKRKPWDLILWPFQTMQELEVLAPTIFPATAAEIPQEWIDQLKILDPNFLIPSSCQFIHEDWSWYNHRFFPISYQYFQKIIKPELKSLHQIIRLDPSKSIYLNHNSISIADNLEWIELKTNEIVDYKYDLTRPIPPTSEIAKNFRALSDIEHHKIIHFCTHEILNLYLDIPKSEEPFFSENRIWKLSLFGHLQESLIYYYEVTASSLKLLPNQLHLDVHWSTEIPMTKLYQALFEGESLTSIYLRIHNEKYSVDLQKDLSQIDLAEDPLIRVLYLGKFATYQKGQLRKITQQRTSSN